MRKKLDITRGLTIFINIVLIGMSFGVLAASQSFVVAMYIGMIMVTGYIFKELSVEDYNNYKDEKNMFGTISKGLSLFVFLLFLFGQLVFPWFYLLYIVITVGMMFVVNKKLIMDLVELDKVN